MAKRKAPTVKKPQLSKGAAAKAVQFGRGKPTSLSGQIPAGDKRITANIRADLHRKLKLASVNRETTIGEILEELIDAME